MSDGPRPLAWLFGGTVLVLAGVVGLVTGAFGRLLPAGSTDGLLAAVVLAGLSVAVWHLNRDGDDRAGGPTADRPAGTADERAGNGHARPGTNGERDPVAAATPEYAATDDVLSGRGLSWLLEDAGEVAREERTVEAGAEWLRPTLRAVLLDVLAHEYTDRAAAEAAVDDGTWTDDPVAAAMLAPTVRGPSLTLRERVYAWLFPERVLRERVRVTVDELARVADDALSAVPGETAPRTVPVVTPSVDDLQRTATGQLDLAADVDDGTTAARDPAGRADDGTQATDAASRPSADGEEGRR